MNEAQTEERTNSERALLRTVHCALCVYEGYSDRCTVHAQGTRYTLHPTLYWRTYAETWSTGTKNVVLSTVPLLLEYVA